MRLEQRRRRILISRAERGGLEAIDRRAWGASDLGCLGPVSESARQGQAYAPNYLRQKTRSHASLRSESECFGVPSSDEGAS
jgi:hypothetical protein